MDSLNERDFFFDLFASKTFSETPQSLSSLILKLRLAGKAPAAMLWDWSPLTISLSLLSPLEFMKISTHCRHFHKLFVMFLEIKVAFNLKGFDFETAA